MTKKFLTNTPAEKQVCNSKMSAKYFIKRSFSLLLAIVIILICFPAVYVTAVVIGQPVQLNHGGTITQYATIQAAVDASADGDTINIPAGAYKEQVTVTKNISLLGAGMGQTIIQSPDAADLVQSGADWKNLKNQDVYDVIGVKTTMDGAVTIKNLTVDGRDQGFLSDARYPDKNSYDFHGIGAYNSTVTIDKVKVTGVRESITDYGLTVPVGYTPQDQPAGTNHNDSIFAESAEGAGTHTLTIKNSIVTKFQKTAILAWGPTLVVNIDHNTIQGYGQTLFSTGNGIQIASSDRSSLGGANGDRTGTTGKITNNRILGIGLVIPEQGLPGYYYNPGLLNVSGILVYQAGDGLQITGNTISRTYVPSWHDSCTSYNNDGYGSTGIDIYDNSNSVIRNNIISGYDEAIYEETGGSPVPGSKMTVAGNIFSNNGMDIWCLGGDDQITLGAGSDIISYHTTGNGTDTITNFRAGDKINVIGFASVGGVDSVNGKINGSPVVDFTGGTVTAGDGTNVAAYSVQVSAYGNGKTTLYIDTDGIAGPAELQINLAGRYTPKNFALNGGYISYVSNVTPAVSNQTIPADSGIDILVNGKAETAATATTEEANGKTVLTVTVDDTKIEEKLQTEGNNAVVTIPVNKDADVVIGQLNGQVVKNMETKEAVLEIRTENVTYTIPASEINIDNISTQIGGQVVLKDIKVNVSVAEPPAETVKIVEDSASRNNYQVVVKPIEFEITCTSGNKTVEVSKFNGYVERMVAIPDGIDQSKITTGIVLNSDGTFSHVPTAIVIINGKYYARINSLTNSTYSVIWNPKTFKDVENHWAKDAVNDMGSRLVISGVGDNNFEPDRDITRAEFAAIVVKALGLMKPGTGKDTFKDTARTDWYYDAVSIAYEYGIISGYGNDKFGPMDKITREQAMTMISRAMKITGLKVELKTADTGLLLKGFGDSKMMAGYAENGAASCIKAGIVTGKGGNLIAPKENITRAEVAVMVRKLLQKSGLI